MVTVKVPSMSSTPLKAIFFFSTRLEEVDDVHWKLHWPGSRAPTQKRLRRRAAHFWWMPAYFVVKLNVMPLILSTHTHKMAVKSPPKRAWWEFSHWKIKKNTRKWWITKSAAAEYKNYQFNRPTEKCSPKTRWKIGTLKLCLDKYIPSHGPPGSSLCYKYSGKKIK